MQKTYLVLLLSVFILCSCSKFQRIQKKADVKGKYKAAVKYYGKRDYYRAGLLFEEIIPLLQGDTTAENAQFKFAYCQYYQGQLTMSAYLFNKFYETFARSPLAEEARYMYAFSLYQDSPQYNLDQTNTLKAIDALQAFINSYPESKFVEEGTNLLKELRAKLEKKAYEQAKLFNKIQGNYKAAIVTLNNFQKGFPDSDYNEEIAYKKLEAGYRLARESVEAKKKERYESTVEFYEYFVDRYPTSKFIRQAENIYTNCLEFLGGKGEKTDPDSKKKAETKNETPKEGNN